MPPTGAVPSSCSGMHRSGTSALTRVLSLLGAALPQHILGAGPGNETGHWEPLRLVGYHDRMLAISAAVGMIGVRSISAKSRPRSAARSSSISPKS